MGKNFFSWTGLRKAVALALIPVLLQQPALSIVPAKTGVTTQEFGSQALAAAALPFRYEIHRRFKTGVLLFHLLRASPRETRALIAPPVNTMAAMLALLIGGISAGLLWLIGHPQSIKPVLTIASIAVVGMLKMFNGADGSADSLAAQYESWKEEDGTLVAPDGRRFKPPLKADDDGNGLVTIISARKDPRTGIVVEFRPAVSPPDFKPSQYFGPSAEALLQRVHTEAERFDEAPPGMMSFFSLNDHGGWPDVQRLLTVAAQYAETDVLALLETGIASREQWDLLLPVVKTPHATIHDLEKAMIGTELAAKTAARWLDYVLTAIGEVEREKGRNQNTESHTPVPDEGVPSDVPVAALAPITPQMIAARWWQSVLDNYRRYFPSAIKGLLTASSGQRRIEIIDQRFLQRESDAPQPTPSAVQKRRAPENSRPIGIPPILRQGTIPSEPLRLSDPELYQAAVEGKLTGRFWLSLDPSQAQVDVLRKLNGLMQGGVLDVIGPNTRLGALDKSYQLSPPFRGLPPNGQPRGIVVSTIGNAALQGILSFRFWSSLPTAARNARAQEILKTLEEVGVLDLVEIKKQVRVLRLNALFAKNFLPAPVELGPASNQPPAIANGFPGGSYRVGMKGILDGKFDATVMSVTPAPGELRVEVSVLSGAVKLELSSKDISRFVPNDTTVPANSPKSFGGKIQILLAFLAISSLLWLLFGGTPPVEAAAAVVGAGHGYATALRATEWAAKAVATLAGAGLMMSSLKSPRKASMSESDWSRLQDLVRSVLKTHGPEKVKRALTIGQVPVDPLNLLQPMPRRAPRSSWGKKVEVILVELDEKPESASGREDWISQGDYDAISSRIAALSFSQTRHLAELSGLGRGYLVELIQRTHTTMSHQYYSALQEGLTKFEAERLRAPLQSTIQRLREMRAALDSAMPWRSPGPMPAGPLERSLPGTLAGWLSETLNLRGILDDLLSLFAESQLLEPAGVAHGLISNLLDLLMNNQQRDVHKLLTTDTATLHRLRLGKWVDHSVLKRLISVMVERDAHRGRQVYFQSISGGRFNGGVTGVRPPADSGIAAVFRDFQSKAVDALLGLLRGMRNELSRGNRKAFSLEWSHYFYPHLHRIKLTPAKVARDAARLGLPIEAIVRQVWPEVDLIVIRFLGDPQGSGGLERSTQTLETSA